MDAGFDVHAERRLGSSRYAPAADWNGKFENEWVLEYTRYAPPCCYQATSCLSKLHGHLNAHSSTTCLTDTKLSAECTRKGYLSVFTIHCSLQAASGRMFLHAREQDNPSNIRYMGLTVNKYIPDVKQAKSESWEGAIRTLLDQATGNCRPKASLHCLQQACRCACSCDQER